MTAFNNNNLLKMAESSTIVDDVEEHSETSDQSVSDVDGKKYKSQVWKFFTKKGKRAVTCNVCNAGLAYHGGTSCMLQHLKRKHPCEHIVKPEEKQKQKKLDTFTRKHACSAERADVISDRIANMIIKDLRPINIVNGKGFQELISFLEPGYRLPSHTHFTSLIERKYTVVKQTIRDVLQEQVEFIAITADLWTSVATESYLTVTYHFLNKQWEMKSVISGTVPLSESHTTTNIVAWIKELVDESGIKSDKVVAFVHDNCKNIENGGNTLEEEHGWLSLGCAGHTLQLCVNSGLEIPVISRAIAAGQRLNTHFRKSEPALRAT